MAKLKGHTDTKNSGGNKGTEVNAQETVESTGSCRVPGLLLCEIIYGLVVEITTCWDLCALNLTASP